ncbi:hypothetical protein VB773_04745 [Haloarculaceae archaeon H-GB2-1]|nr:hypothetical protein [Haloarculaceae archaeon H-GB2-1]
MPTASTVVATGLLVLGVALVGLTGPNTVAVLAGLLGGAGLAVVVALVTTDDPLAATVGGLFVVPVALGVTVALGYPLRLDGAVAVYGPVLASLAVAAGYSATSHLTGSLDGDVPGGGAKTVAANAALLGLAATVLAALHAGLGTAFGFVGGIGQFLVEAAVRPSWRPPHLATFGLLLATAAASVRFAIWSVPWEPFLPQHRRERWREAADALAHWLSVAIGVSLLLALLGVGVLTSPVLDGSSPLRSLLTAVTTALPIRVLLLGVVVTASTVGGASLVTTKLATSAGPRARWWATRTAGTLAFALVAVAAVSEAVLLDALASLGPAATAGRALGIEIGAPAVVLGSLAAASWLVVGGLVAVLVIRGLFLGPHNRAGALGGGCLFGLAVVATLAGSLPVVVTFVTVALALAAWDVGSYGVVTSEELGRRAPTGRAELAHAGGTLAMGATLVGVSTVGYLLLAGVEPLTGTSFAVAAALALVSVALLAPFVRG